MLIDLIALEMGSFIKFCLKFTFKASVCQPFYTAMQRMPKKEKEKKQSRSEPSYLCHLGVAQIFKVDELIAHL